MIDLVTANDVYRVLLSEVSTFTLCDFGETEVSSIVLGIKGGHVLRGRITKTAYAKLNQYFRILDFAVNKECEPVGGYTYEFCCMGR